METRKTSQRAYTQQFLKIILFFELCLWCIDKIKNKCIQLSKKLKVATFSSVFLYYFGHLMCIVLLVFYLSDNIGGLVAHSSRITDSAVLPSIGANLPPGKENLWGLSGTRIYWVTHRSERSKLTYQEKFGGYWENLKKAAGVYWVSSNIGLRSPQFLLSAWTITLPSHHLKQRIDILWFWETFECADEIFCHILLKHCSTSEIWITNFVIKVIVTILLLVIILNKIFLKGADSLNWDP